MNNEIVVTPVSSTLWRLELPLVYTGKFETFTVPEGYITDFATIPRVIVWLIPRYGSYTKAAVVHDWLLTELIPRKEITSYDADGIFKRIMRELEVPFTRRWLMWTGVRWGALFSTKRSYQRNFRKDAPKVIGISLLALPIILPGVIGVSVSLTFIWLFSMLSGKPKGSIWKT